VNKITTLGIDLAKTVFQLHGVDVAGKIVLRREVRRGRLMTTIAQLEPCLIGIEACGGANYYTRALARLARVLRRTVIQLAMEASTYRLRRTRFGMHTPRPLWHRDSLPGTTGRPSKTHRIARNPDRPMAYFQQKSSGKRR
jgi:transposase